MSLAAITRWVVAAAALCALVFFGVKGVYSRDQKTLPVETGSVAARQITVSTPSLTTSDETDTNSSSQPRTLHSKAGVVVNADTGKIIYAENAFEILPMASITKIMSSMVALDNKISLGKVVSIPPDDYTIGGNLRIVAGRETVKVKDLFYASITGSANNAALAIAKLVNLSEDEFVSAMNRKAVELKLESLHFEEASGLSPKNSGNAYDIARMAGYAFSRYPLILDAASQAEYRLTTQNTRREHTIKNPDDLFKRATGQFLASKTGYLDEALYCLVLAKKTPSGMIVAVTLGNADKDDGENETLGLLQKGESILVGANTNN